MPESNGLPHRRNQDVLTLNVGGKCFPVSCRAALKYPITRIGQLATCTDPVKKLELCDDYSVLKDEYFFDRDPLLFHHVAHFYRSGILWTVSGVCPAGFLEELDYWGIPLNHAPRCCRIILEEKQDEVAEDLKAQQELEAKLEPAQREERFEGGYLGQFRMAAWNLMEKPSSSIPAKTIAVLSCIFVLLSIAGMMLSTVEELQQKTHLEQLETLYATFFSLEYLGRLLSAATPCQFFRAALHPIDLVSLLPFYVPLFLEALSQEATEAAAELHRAQDAGRLGRVLKLLKLLHIFRVLKLARHSTGLRAFGFTLRRCCRPVCCLFLFIAMGIFTSSALMHATEHDVPGTNFTSIPDAWWWAAVSLSTVGYGDTVPDTLLGRLVAFGCISFGIILNGMPISILYNQFSDYYAKLKSREKAATPALKRSRQLSLKERTCRQLGQCSYTQSRAAGPQAKPTLSAGDASPPGPPL